VAIIGGILAILATHKEGGELPEPGPDQMTLYRCMDALSEATADGAKKYAPHDWHCGQMYSTLYNSLMRHINAMLIKGPDSVDSESNVRHVSHALWNALCILTFGLEGRGEELDDISKYIDQNTEAVEKMQGTPEPGSVLEFKTDEDLKEIRQTLQQEATSEGESDEPSSEPPDGLKIFGFPGSGNIE